MREAWINSLAGLGLALLLGCASGQSPANLYFPVTSPAKLRANRIAELRAAKAKALEHDMRGAMATWRYDDREVPFVELPPRSGRYPGVRKIEPYGPAFVVVFEADPRRAPGPLIYVVDDSSSGLRPMQLEDCDELHDVAAIGDGFYWVCRSVDRWSLRSEIDGVVDVEQLPMDAGFVRLGEREGEPIVFDERRIYARTLDAWTPFYVDPRADLQEFGSGRRLSALVSNGETWALPSNGDTAHIMGEFLYVWSGSSQVGGQVWRLDLRGTEQGFESLVQYADFLPTSVTFHASTVTPARAGGLWILAGSQFQGTLLRLTPSDHYIHVLVGSVEYTLQRDDMGLHLPDFTGVAELEHRVPARAAFEDEDGLWLVGFEGVAQVVDGIVTPIVRFRLPRGMDPREMLALDLGFDYRLEARVLARFDDGTFLIGDQYNGVYRLRAAAQGWELSLLFDLIADRPAPGELWPDG